MNIKEAILSNLEVLPPEKQLEVLDFTEFLKYKGQLLPDREIHKQRANNWKKWVESHEKDSAGLSDEAIRRETIYE